jgi:hypothetical protein
MYTNYCIQYKSAPALLETTGGADDTCNRGANMAKVTLHVNLFPCTRDLPTCSYTDLADDLALAKMFARTASQIFWIRNGAVLYSGCAWKGHDGLTIKVWYQDRVYRTARVPGLPYSAVLHVDVTSALVRKAIGCDVVGDLYPTEADVQEDSAEIVFGGQNTVSNLKGKPRRRETGS